MEMKRFPIILLAALLIIGLAACTRPASRPPTGQTTPTSAEGGFPLPGTSDVMGQLEVFATQTAIALQGGGVPQATQAPVQATPGEGTPAGGGTAAGETPTAGEVPATQAPITEAPAGAATSAPAEATQPPQPAAPTNTMVPIPTATPGGIPTSYKLKGGEFPYCIARRFDVDPGELLSLNGLGPNSATSAGMTLQIPQTGKSFPGQRALKAHPSAYTVQAGDTVNSIACQFGDVDPNNIIIANGLNGSGDITAGQSLQIP